MQVYGDALPVFGGVMEALRDGVTPGAIEQNRQFVADDITAAEVVDEATMDLSFDAQTSGGLVASVQADRHGQLVEALRRRGAGAWTVGRVTGRSDGRIVVTLSGQELPSVPQAA